MWKSLIESNVTKGENLGPRKTGWVALADVGDDIEKPILGINQEVYEQKLRLCGYAALVYDAPKSNEKQTEPVTQLWTADIPSAYKQQCRIEECFRIMKNDLGLRPMYVWISNHVRGHVTVCVLVLLYSSAAVQAQGARDHDECEGDRYGAVVGLRCSIQNRRGQAVRS